jgi:riboflavin biosynthesis pyrimidine reductase
VRQLYPSDAGAGEVDPVDFVAAESRPASDDRPWVLVNMIASVDGATHVEGRSGGLGGPADTAMFRALRGVPDVILVGAGTVAAETYHPPTAPDEIRAARLARGQAALPRIAMVSSRLGIEPDAPVFDGDDPATRPVIVTTTAADPARVERLAAVADVVQAGDRHVDLVAALRGMRRGGARCVLCEGGPTLNGTLLDAEAVDELCLTTAPLVLGGDASPIIKQATSRPRRVRLDRILEADGLLFSRYLFPAG